MQCAFYRFKIVPTQKKKHWVIYDNNEIVSAKTIKR